MATAMSSALFQVSGAQGVAAAGPASPPSHHEACRIALAPAGLGRARLVAGHGCKRVRAASRHGVVAANGIRAALSAGSSSQQEAGAAAARPMSSKHEEDSRMAQVAAVVVDAVRRVAEVVRQFLTATPLPRPRSAEEAALAASLRGSLVLAAGPLFFASTSVSTPLTVVASGMAKWLELYSGVLMVRVLLSWFPNIPWERQPLQAMRDMCDPYLNLFRNIIPPIFNALDVSPMLAFLVLGTLTSILNTSVQG